MSAIRHKLTTRLHTGMVQK